MKKTVKRILAALLVVVMFVGIAPIGVLLEAKASNSDGFLYNLSELPSTIPTYPEKGQKYWVVFNEGCRGNRLEMSTFDVEGGTDSPYIVWNGNLLAKSNTGSVSRSNQFSYTESEWIYDRNYGILSDKATKVFSSNVDVYDANGNILVKATSELETNMKFVNSNQETKSNKNCESYFILNDDGTFYFMENAYEGFCECIGNYDIKDNKLFLNASEYKNLLGSNEQGIEQYSFDIIDNHSVRINSNVHVTQKNDVFKCSEKIEKPDYSEVINQYVELKSNNFYRDKIAVLGDMDDYIKKYVSKLLVTHKTINGDLSNDIWYSLYDIDKNGVDELIISDKNDGAGNIYDIFTYANGDIYSLHNELYGSYSSYGGSWGERSKISLYKNGVIGIYGSGGANVHEIDFYRIGTDGYSMIWNFGIETLYDKYYISSPFSDSSSKQEVNKELYEKGCEWYSSRCYPANDPDISPEWKSIEDVVSPTGTKVTILENKQYVRIGGTEMSKVPGGQGAGNTAVCVFKDRISEGDFNNSDFVWTSGDDTILRVTGSSYDFLGNTAFLKVNVLGVSDGTTTLTVTTSDGAKSTCVVNVTNKLTDEDSLLDEEALPANAKIICGKYSDYIITSVINGDKTYISDVIIDGTTYATEKNFMNGKELDSMKNQNVVAIQVDGKITEMNTLNRYISTKLSTNAIGGLGYKENEKYPIEVYFQNSLSSNLNKVNLSRFIADTSVNINHVEMYISSNKGGTTCFYNSDINKTVSLGNSDMLVQTELKMEKSYVTSDGFAYITIYASGEKNGKAVNYSVPQCRIEILSKKEWNKISESTVKKDTSSDIAKASDAEIEKVINENKNKLKLKDTIAWNASLNDFLNDSQLNALGYAMVGTIVMSEAPRQTFEEYLTDKILDKLKVAHKISVGLFSVEVPMYVRVKSPKYGMLEIKFTANATNYTLSGNKFGTFGNVDYEIVGGSGMSKVPENNRKGLAGVIAYADINAFAEGMYNIAMAEIKKAYNLGYGNDFNKVCDVFFNDTIVDMLLKSCKKDYKGALFDIMSYPATKYRGSCPIEMRVYDKDGKLCAFASDEKVVSIDENVECELDGHTKTVTISGWNIDDYKVEITATGNGKMNLAIDNVAGSCRVMRTQIFNDYTLINGGKYELINGDILLDSKSEIVYNGKSTLPTDDIIYDFRTIEEENESDSIDFSKFNVGDEISFGSYPQTEVTDETTLKNLNSLSINWSSYDYSYGKSITDSAQATTSDYMQYADIVYGGEKYRAVKMSQLRPSINYYPSSTTYSEQDDNGYDDLNKVYWFKYEPLKWIVLDSTSGLVMCKNVIDSQEFNKKIFDDKYGDSNHNYFANNYEQSSIRNWLNKDFYNIAFSSADKTCIEEKTLSNVAYDKAQFNSGDTTDKITLLSFAEYQKIKNDYRLWQAGCSNYALCQGVSSNSGNTVAEWMLRTAGTWSDVICSVSDSGSFSTSSTETYNSSMGIRPAIYLKTKNSESKPEIQGVSVGSDIEINYKKSETINYSVTADKGAEYTVSFSSSNPSVARVDENGKVYGAKRGSATITCTVTDEFGNTVSDSCNVNVKYSFGQWLIKILLFGWIWY